jgi:hypothetical protein
MSSIRWINRSVADVLVEPAVEGFPFRVGHGPASHPVGLASTKAFVALFADASSVVEAVFDAALWLGHHVSGSSTGETSRFTDVTTLYSFMTLSISLVTSPFAVPTTYWST